MEKFISLEEVEEDEQRKKALREMFTREVKSTESETQAVKKETTEENSVDVGAPAARYSLSKNAKQEVKLTDVSPSILIGHKGVRNLPMMMKASHIRENIFTEAEAKAKGLKIDKSIHYHGLGKTSFLKVIDDLDNVTEAYRGTKNAENPERRENYFLLISKQTDGDENIINVPVYINKKGTYNRVVIDTNKIATVFGKDEIYSYIREQISKGNLVRIKKRNIQTSESTALIAANYGKNISTNIIRENSEKSTENAKKVEKSSRKSLDVDSAAAKNAERKKKIKAILRKYMHRLNISEETKADVIQKYGEKTAKRLFNVWENTTNRADGVDIATAHDRLWREGFRTYSEYEEDFLMDMDTTLKIDMDITLKFFYMNI